MSIESPHVFAFVPERHRERTDFFFLRSVVLQGAVVNHWVRSHPGKTDVDWSLQFSRAFDVKFSGKAGDEVEREVRDVVEKLRHSPAPDVEAILTELEADIGRIAQDLPPEKA